MGDFTDLADLTERAAALGASAVGVNPLHALFPADANHISPYSPSSRLFLNVFYLDPDGGARPRREQRGACHARRWRLSPRAGECPRRRAGRLSRRCGVSSCACSSSCSRRSRGATLPPRPSGRWRSAISARRWVRRSSSMPCSRRCTSMRCRPAGPGPGRTGRRRCSGPDTPEVAAFAREHRARVDFFAYLQWLADQQLAAAQRRARAAGMPIGLYQDIAVGVSPASAMAWANPGVTLSRGQRGRAARLVQSARAELGAGAAFPGRPARGRLRGVQRRRCATTCATPARCASTTSWGCSACSGSRQAPRRPRAPMCATRSPTSHASSRSNWSAIAAW